MNYDNPIINYYKNFIKEQLINIFLTQLKVAKKLSTKYSKKW